jgi:Asp/Glu/hydantoin racemase
MPDIKIWYQSYLDSDSGGTYWEKLRAHLAAVADSGTQIHVRGISPPDSYAHPLMEWRCAREMICNAVAAERQGYDAFIVGHFQDAGLYEARGAVDMPVLGLGETSMLYACKLGQRLGLVTFKPDYMPWFHHQIARYGLKERIAAVFPMPIAAPVVAAAMQSDDARQALYREFEERVQPLLDLGADVLIPTGGGPMMLMSGLKQVRGAPVIDGTAIAVKMAEVAVKLRRMTGLGVSRVGEFAKAPPHVIAEFLAHPKGL